MKNRSLLSFSVISLGFLLLIISSCRKINDPTTLGDELIPPIDNVTTFETFLDIESDNKLLTDTNKVYYDDEIAIGQITNDLTFGSTKAEGYFNFSLPSYGLYPFAVKKDSIEFIDSVVLSLAYSGGYGDTANTSAEQELDVYEISQLSDFSDTVGYRYNHAPFTTNTTKLGSKKFKITSLRDSAYFYRRSGDTARIANVIRIKLDQPGLGDRFKNYDTSLNAFTGAYRSDTTFKKFFRGIAIKVGAGTTANALTYIDPANTSGTKLIIYYRTKNNGVKDTLSTEFYHLTGGQANIVDRTPAGPYAANIANATPNDNELYIQSTPGSYALLSIPGLSSFPNAVIHRAEIIATPLPTAQDNLFPKPSGLFLDQINAANDTAFTFDADMGLSAGSGFLTYNPTSFGGLLTSGNNYRFNISRYVQSIVTRKTPNYKLRLFAPVRAFVYAPTYGYRSQIYVNARVAAGRVVLAGGNYPDITKRLRLRIVYSKL